MSDELNSTTIDSSLPSEEDVSQRPELTDAEYEEVLRKEAERVQAIQAVDPMFTPYEFDATFAKFFMDNTFFGCLTMEITKVFDISQPTAYIGVRKNGRSHEIIMGFNPRWFRNMVEKQRLGVIKHELYHLIFGHVFSRMTGDNAYSYIHNVATDLANNSIIGKENLPPIVLIPGHRPLMEEPMVDKDGKPIIDPKTKKQKTNPNKLIPCPGEYADFIEKAPTMQSSDYYFEELKKIQDKLGDKDNSIAISQGIGTMDGHDNWGDLPKEVQEQIRDRVRDLMEKGVNKADRNNSWGDIPMEIQEQIRRMVSREIDWRTVVRNFIGRCRSMQRSSTVRKVNKKVPYIQPGVKRPLISNFACFIDQSGSMSDSDICLLFGELEGLANLTEIDVWHFDTEVDLKSKTTWKKGKPFPKAHRTRCGGTDFQSVVDFVNSRENRGKYSGILILTDGFAPSCGAVIGARTLWVITETGTMAPVRAGDLVVKMKQDKQFKKA